MAVPKGWRRASTFTSQDQLEQFNSYWVENYSQFQQGDSVKIGSYTETNVTMTVYVQYVNSTVGFCVYERGGTYGQFNQKRTSVSAGMNTIGLSNADKDFNRGSSGSTGYNQIYYQAKNYTLTYHLNGGLLSEELDTLTSELPNPLPTPTRENYVFMGWFYDSNFTSQASSGDYINENTNLYAKFSTDLTPQELFTITMNSLNDSINTKAGTTGKHTVEELKTAVDGIAVQKVEQSKNATPTTSEQTITPDTGKALSSVVISGVTSAIDSNISASNIKSGVTILGVSGSLEVPSGSLDITENGNNVDVTNKASVNVNVPQGTPIEIDTAAGMNAVLISANVGKIYKFTGTTDSDYTNGEIYQVLITTLDAPTISIADDTLTITNPSSNGTNVTGYKVYGGDTLLETIQTTTYDLSSLNLEDGTYSITVIAYGTDCLDSSASESASYVVQSTLYYTVTYSLVGGDNSMIIGDTTYSNQSGTLTLPAGTVITFPSISYCGTFTYGVINDTETYETYTHTLNSNITVTGIYDNACGTCSRTNITITES